MAVLLNRSRRKACRPCRLCPGTSASCRDFRVEGLHALPSQLAVLFDLLFADAAEDDHRRIILVRGPGVQHIARTILREVGGVFLAGVSELLRLLLGVEVIEIAIPLVEAMDSGQELIAVAQVVLAELGGRIALRFQTPRPASGLPSGYQSVEPGMPMVVSPVLRGICPVMNAARPAVQLAWP